MCACSLARYTREFPCFVALFCAVFGHENKKEESRAIPDGAHLQMLTFVPLLKRWGCVSVTDGPAEQGRFRKACTCVLAIKWAAFNVCASKYGFPQPYAEYFDWTICLLASISVLGLPRAFSF